MSDNMLFATEDQMTGMMDSQDGIPEVLTDKYLIFISEGLKFGLDAEYVVEIITSHAITPLPMVPNFVSGIINLRGQIIPIIDIRLRLGKTPQKNDCIIVININGTQIGILVDTVDQMVDIAQGSIAPMPAQNTQELISGMCSLQDGSTMLVLDCVQLLHS